MDSKISQVLEKFSAGYNCCQALVATYSEIYGLDRETALKMSAGLGGGVGHCGEICGFVIGACLVLGLKHGTDKPDAKQKLNPICQKFCREFEQKFGALTCRGIICYDIGTPEAAVEASTAGAFNICDDCAKFAAELLERSS